MSGDTNEEIPREREVPSLGVRGRGATEGMSAAELHSGGGVSEPSDADRKEQLRARVALSKVVEPLDPKLAPVIVEHGPVEAWDRIRANADGRFDRCVPRVKDLEIDRVLEVADRLGITVLIPGDDAWPDRLDELEYPPVCLWVRGRADLASCVSRSVAIVGARSATSYGVQVAGELGHGLGARGFTVVSGAAFGIDVAAHRGALAAGALTVAAMAGGVDRPYPAAHTRVLAQIESQGLVVAESPPGSSPQRQRFLARNRLIAALTPGTVVVEAGLRSGSLNTVGHAEGLSRVVAAVPGSVYSPASAGCHALLRDGRAVLVTDADECAELLGEFGRDAAPVKRGEERARDGLDEVPRRVFDALNEHRPATVDRLTRAAGLSASEVMTGLGHLQLQGLAMRAESGWKRVPHA